jgi:hypothetical protein
MYLVSAVLGAILMLGIPANNADNNVFEIGVIKKDLSFYEYSDLQNDVSVTFTAARGGDGVMVVELVDIYIDKNGKRSIAPLGATPYSAKGYVEIKNNVIPYLSSPDKQQIDVDLKFFDVDQLNSPILGGVRIQRFDNLVAVDSKNEGVEMQVGAVSIFSFTPPGSAGLTGANPEVTIDGPNLLLSKSENFAYKLLPNFERFFNSNDLAASFNFANTGNIFFSTDSTLTVSKLQVLDTRKNTVVYEETFRQPIFMPGESRDRSVELTISSDKSPQDINPIDNIGIYKITLKNTAIVDKDTLIEQENSKFFVVFPWKIFVYLFLFIAIRAFVKSRRVKRDVSKSVTQEIPIVEFDPEIERMLEAIKPVKKKKVAKKKTPVKKKRVAKVAKRPVKKVAKKAVKKKVKAKS